MNKILCALIVIALFQTGSQKASAQVGIQTGVMLPVGDWSEYWGGGIGGQLSYKVKVADRITIGAALGYYTLSGKQINVSGNEYKTPNASLVPILATINYGVGEKLFVGLDAGYNVISHDGGVFVFSTGAADAAESNIALAPKVGLKMGKFSFESSFNVLQSNYLSILIGYTL